ncbi:calcineurin-like phosphoesterase superfamily domain-containing protein [Ditylenchus destructor]|nr:calcineurin-like phosphoesterase superfamily domain-containing protein [Ditylenchus destructor]
MPRFRMRSGTGRREPVEVVMRDGPFIRREPRGAPAFGGGEHRLREHVQEGAGFGLVQVQRRGSIAVTPSVRWRSAPGSAGPRRRCRGLAGARRRQAARGGWSSATPRRRARKSSCGGRACARRRRPRGRRRRCRSGSAAPAGGRGRAVPARAGRPRNEGPASRHGNHQVHGRDYRRTPSRSPVIKLSSAARNCRAMLTDTLMAAAISNDPPVAEAEDGGSLRVRTVWISDLHLGTPGCQAKALLEFLREVECEQLFLVGDIVDGWRLRRTWYWPQGCNDVVQKLLRKARKGTRVIFVPGNHDEFARKYLQHSFGGIEVAQEWIHETADGRKLWVTHGDLFDGVIQHAKWLAYLGDSAYEFTLKLNRHLNSLRARLGLPYWSLSKYLSSRSSGRSPSSGVVCGHIHKAELRDVGGILYANDGDWVESLTALAEHADGHLEILDWAERQRAQAADAQAAVAAAMRAPA